MFLRPKPNQQCKWKETCNQLFEKETVGTSHVWQELWCWDLPTIWCPIIRQPVQKWGQDRTRNDLIRNQLLYWRPKWWSACGETFTKQVAIVWGEGSRIPVARPYRHREFCPYDAAGFWAAIARGRRPITDARCVPAVCFFFNASLPATSCLLNV